MKQGWGERERERERKKKREGVKEIERDEEHKGRQS